MITLLLALALALPSAAAPVRLALIEDTPTHSTLQLAQPLERVLREAGPDASLVGVESVPVYFGGPDYSFRLPSGIGAPNGEKTSSAAVLEGAAEVVFVFPAEPSLVEALRLASADPKTFRIADSIRLAIADAEFTSTTGAEGQTLLALRTRLQHPATGRMRSGLAAYYRFRWKGRDAAVAVIGRTFGGLGRLATVAKREAMNNPFTGLARGGTFGSSLSDARGRKVLDALEKAGLRYASVSDSEIANWPALKAYAAERPDGVQWLSANIVYSTAPSVTALSPYAVFEASGVRVAVAGLTPTRVERLLKINGLDGLKIIDPLNALEPLIPRLRAEADLVIVLSDLSSADQARLSTLARGLDLIIGDNAPFLSHTPPPATIIEEDDRPVFANAFPPLRAYDPALNLIEVERTPDDERVDWRVAQSAILLDDSINPAPGYPERSFDAFSITSSTIPPLLPDAREVFPASERAGGFPVYESRDFWTLAAGALSERGKAEVGLLLAPGLGVSGVGEIHEPYVRGWLGESDAPVIVALRGSQLSSLISEAGKQAAAEAAGIPLGGRPRFVVGGVDAKKRVRGAPLDAAGTYRVATSLAAAEALGLPQPREPMPGVPAVGAAVLDELRARAGKTSPADYRLWMTGSPLTAPGLWRLNFRDVGLNLRQTKVVRSNDFDPVPNSRVQGFNELLIGGVFKTDAEYLKSEFKWTNTVEAEYARSRIEPRNAPATTNVAANRLILLTLGTRRAGGIRQEWLARSWGPSLGFQFDGEFESAPGLKRKQVYSLFPGVEFFDGTFIRSLELAGIIKRDLGREPPNTQSGLRLRSVFSRELGPAKALLQGELWNNYFFLTKQDTAGDLRLEGDFNVKLRIPVRKYLSIAPFFDFYWFQLKTRPTRGYSMTMGVSIGFSRLWKPQYEDF
ncbi:MAG: hypothetical protein COV48_01875 [Elusimicrobia bacterium CG11_big_fil_rev_8_21_14_0_20_64_6]|nr:MAG: hypothetical protein COV48_01875 [Elusimicrobia bacterium CG11_big_fil_rev_8_21_14_0_20_64_6]